LCHPLVCFWSVAATRTFGVREIRVITWLTVSVNVLLTCLGYIPVCAHYVCSVLTRMFLLLGYYPRLLCHCEILSHSKHLQPRPLINYFRSLTPLNFSIHYTTQKNQAQHMIHTKWRLVCEPCCCYQGNRTT